MKKIISIIMLFILSLPLWGCFNGSANVSYIDKDGNEQTLKIEKTDDKEKIVEIFSVLEEVEVEEASNLNLGGKIELSAALKANAITAKVSLGLNFEAKADVKSELAYAACSIAGKIEASFEGQNEKIEIDAGIKLYAISDFAYIDIYGEGLESFNIEEQKVKLPLNELVAELSEMFDGFLSGNQTPDVQTPNIEDLVEMYQIQITDTSKSTFTLKLNYPLSNISPELTETLDLFITIDTKTLLPAEISLDASKVLNAVVGEIGNFIELEVSDTVLKINAKCKYEKTKVPTLTEQEKNQFLIPDII